MKVKLLKKIRKRYSITYYPYGGYIHGDWNDFPFIILEDNNSSFKWRIFKINSIQTKNIQYLNALDRMRGWIREDYKVERKRRNIVKEKLWFR